MTKILTILGISLEFIKEVSLRQKIVKYNEVKDKFE